MGFFTVTKDPDATLDYGHNWAEWLGTDTITASEWVCADDDLTIDSDSHDATTTTVWISGGVVGTSYTVTNRITTAQGRIDDRSVTIKVKEK